MQLAWNKVLRARNKLAMKSVVEFPQIMRFHLITSSSNLPTSPSTLPVCDQQQLHVLIGLSDFKTSITNQPLHFRATKRSLCTYCASSDGVWEDSDKGSYSLSATNSQTCVLTVHLLVEWSNKNMTINVLYSYVLLNRNFKYEIRV